MRSPRQKAVLVLGVLLLTLTLPAFSGGNDTPAIPPGGKSTGEGAFARVDGGDDGPITPPGGHKPHGSDQRLSNHPFSKAHLGQLVLRLLLTWS